MYNDALLVVRPNKRAIDLEKRAPPSGSVNLVSLHITKIV